MQEKAKARLRELVPAARGSQDAGFTKPSLHLFLHICIFGAIFHVSNLPGEDSSVPHPSLKYLNNPERSGDSYSNASGNAI